ncbi:MAG: aminomethyl-transferring glycine dehydrogenase [Cardiobacteriaceae bacterium]|nr:aminomethyl-transferring glycine dehydrogenase [Cardiobacteriaceae bacterium]
MTASIPSTFSIRHTGPNADERQTMLSALGYQDLDSFIQDVIPQDIVREQKMQLPKALSEAGALKALQKIASQNQVKRSLIGQGYYETITPPVILRNIMENPAWYTSYTPYQPEISQGRLEALLNYQTMVAELTGLDIANASLLDEASAAAEAMMLARRQSKHASQKFLVDIGVFPQTLDVVKTRARYQGIEVEVLDYKTADLSQYFGILLQYPNRFGTIENIKSAMDKVHEHGGLAIVATDLLASTLLVSAGELGADIAVGSAQRFGVPMGFGGPHAGFMATRDAYKRVMPGRLVGVSKDSRGKAALRLALQTREQHIRREKATSNVCTAQALLAIMAGMYAVYHGAEGLKAIAEKVHGLTVGLKSALVDAGIKVREDAFFDTLTLDLGDKAEAVLQSALNAGFNLGVLEQGVLNISLDEKSTKCEVKALYQAITGKTLDNVTLGNALPECAKRQSAFLTHPTFQSYRTETAMMRYLRKLSDWDLALDRTMIPLGSCTMKLNAAAEMMPVSWAEFAGMHPFAPAEQTAGYRQLFSELESMLADATGYDAVSLQPNSGATGEYAGLLAIRRYQEDMGQGHRDVCLIPASAHGTNPATAALAGMKVVVVACDSNGQVDVEDLRAKALLHRDNLSCIMITYPSTHGAFEPRIREICAIIHDNGGQVYLDGANFNAQVGLAAPGKYGSDVSHLNLHKTFAIPHGGGGPGVGPIGVRSHLAKYLPSHCLVKDEARQGLAVSAAPWGSALVNVIPWMYMRMMGEEGLTDASKVAILNANYLVARLKDAYPILYTDDKGLVAHECIVDLRPIKESSGIGAEDVAKRLMDFGFHAPTMSFPVAGTLMIEPTESENLAELERFAEAMLQIREEIRQVENGTWAKDNNPLVHAPHTLADLVGDWDRPYSREVAVFPVKGMNPARYFTPVNRVDNVYGDKNVQCACPPIESYQ